jgi:hypothetical protein
VTAYAQAGTDVTVTAFRAVRAAAIGALVLSVALVALSVVRPELVSPQPGTFSIGTAIVVAGYFLFPILVVIAGALLLLALMLFIGAAIERRRADPLIDDLGGPSPL